MIDPETGSGAARPCWKTNANSTPPKSKQGHLARLQPEDPGGDQEVRRRARGAVRPLSQDADLRRQRSAAHLARRPARRHRPRRLRPRRLVRRRRSPEPRGPAAAADPRVPQPPATRHRRHGRPAHHRRRYSRPGVHRLPAAGEVPHPLRADARSRHSQGRAVSRTSRTSSSSTASTAHCSSTSARRPPSPPSRPRSHRERSPRSSTTSGRIATATTTSAAWSSDCSASTRKCRARPASTLRLHPGRRRGALRRRTCRATCQTDFTDTMKLLRDQALPGSARNYPAHAASVPHRATRRQDDGVSPNG